MKTENENLKPADVLETPAPEVPAAKAVETAAAPATDEATWMPDPGWVPEPEQVPNAVFRAMDKVKSWVTKQWRQGWVLIYFLMLENRGGWQLICSKKTREQLRSLQARHQACVDTIHSHTSDKAKEAWAAQSQKLSKAIGDGNIHETRGHTREEFESDFNEKACAAHAEMRRIYIETMPIAKTLWARADVILKDCLISMEESEKARYLAWGMDHVQSPLLAQLKKAVATAEIRAKESPNATTSPRDCIPWMDF